MQVNLHWHPNAFASLEEAFDPAVNVDYGAAYLLALKEEHGSWTRAVQFYHSSSSDKQQIYFCRVLRRFHDLTGTAAADLARWCAG